MSTSFRPWFFLFPLAVVSVLLAACDTEEEVVSPTTDTTGAASPTPTVVPSPASTATPLPSIPADWQTYTDPQLGFSFSYPPAWHLTPPAENGGDTILYSYDPATAPGIGGIPKDKLKAFFWVAEGVQEPLEQWLMEGKNSPGQISPPVVISQSEVTLGGRQGLVEVTETDDVRSTSYYVPLNGGRVFVVNSGPSDSQVWPQFDQVLATLRFAS